MTSPLGEFIRRQRELQELSIEIYSAFVERRG